MIEKVIQVFDLDFSDINASGETRVFTISGSDNSEFKLEIKNEDNHYYNFFTNSFQVTQSSLEEKTVSGSYNGIVRFPAVTDDDQYDIYLYAIPGTKHAPYTEVRFGDGSIDANNSTGSNSLMMQKVLYQYTDVTLTISNYSPNGTIELGSLSTKDITLSRGKSLGKTPFEISCSVSTATKSYRIIKQPTSNDVLAFIQPVVGDTESTLIGSTPIDLPGENIYPTMTANGNTNAVMSSNATVTMADTIEDLGLKIGDKVIQATGPFFANIVTVIAITGGGLSANQFTASETVSVGSGVRLDFYNRMNFSWPTTKANLIKEGMIVVPATNVTADTAVGTYEDTITLFEGTKDEKVIIKNARPAMSTVGKKPTIVKGLITAQDGDVVFDKQQALALAGDTLKIGGYGESQIYNLYGYRVRFSDLKISLAEISTTTTSAVSNSTSVPITSRNGILDTISTVSGIGINAATTIPTVVSGAGAVSGGGTIVLSAAQTLEDGITLTFKGAGQTATITGNIEILETGTASQNLRFDVERLLSIT